MPSAPDSSSIFIVVGVVDAGDAQLTELVRHVLAESAHVQLVEADPRELFADVLVVPDAVVLVAGDDARVEAALVAVATAHAELPVIVVRERDDLEAHLALIRAGAHDALARTDLPSLSRALVLAVERRRREHSWRAAAERDELTGLLNRRGYRAAAARLLRHSDPACVCQLFVDLDDLKAINDNYGHTAGDRALVDVAAVLAQSLGIDAVVARVGGDEFAALVPLTPGASPDRAASRLRQALATANRTSRYRVTASVGVVSPTSPDADVDALLAAADEAMYVAKRGRKRRRLLGDQTPATGSWTPAQSQRPVTPSH